MRICERRASTDKDNGLGNEILGPKFWGFLSHELFWKSGPNQHLKGGLKKFRFKKAWKKRDVVW